MLVSGRVCPWRVYKLFFFKTAEPWLEQDDDCMFVRGLANASYMATPCNLAFSQMRLVSTATVSPVAVGLLRFP